MSVNTINPYSNALFTPLAEAVNSVPSSLKAQQHSFLNELKAALTTISQTQTEAQKKTEAFQRGDSNTSLNEVMVDLQKSSVSLQFGIQVRNKLVAAYQEIMNITI